MEAFSGDNSYLALFVVSFIASTIIPLGSEWLLVAMLMNGKSAHLCVLIASSGNYLGGLTNYFIGLGGSTWIIRRLLRITEERETKARAFYERYGKWSLLLSWLPVAGDPLCLIGGIMKTGIIPFSILVFTGKFARYSVLAWLTGEGMKLAIK